MIQRTLLILAAGLLIAADPNEDLKNIQGTWRLSKVVSNGMAEDMPGKVAYVFKGNGVTVQRDEKVLEKWSFKINPGKKSKTFDAVKTFGARPPKQITAIYELDGDTLTICFDGGGKARPKDFTSEKGSQREKWTYRRDKP